MIAYILEVLHIRSTSCLCALGPLIWVYPLYSLLMQTYISISGHADVRAKTIFFLHRMVDSLTPQSLMPLLSDPLRLMLVEARADTVVPVMELLNQIVLKYKVSKVNCETKSRCDLACRIQSEIKHKHLNTILVDTPRPLSGSGAASG